MNQIKHIFRNAKVGIAILDIMTNRIELMNPAFTKLHENEWMEKTDIPLDEILLPNYIQKHVDNLILTCPHGEMIFKTTYFRKDQTSVDLSIHISHIKNGIGKVEKRIINVIDISEYKHSHNLCDDINQFHQEVFYTIYRNYTYNNECYNKQFKNSFRR